MTGLTQCLASMPAPRPTPTTATQHAKSPDIGPMAVPIALFSLFIAIQHAIPYGIGPMSAPSAFLNPTAAKQHAILHDIGPMSGATAFNAFSTTSGNAPVHQANPKNTTREMEHVHIHYEMYAFDCFDSYILSAFIDSGHLFPAFNTASNRRV